MKKLRILVLVAKFDPSGTNPYLTDELCEALLELGHRVDVIFLDWAEAHPAQEVALRDGMRVFIASPYGNSNTLLGKTTKWLFSSLSVAKCYADNLMEEEYDLLISLSPSIIFSLALLRIRHHIKIRLLIQWDFFPFHQAQIGLIPFRWMVSTGAAIESRLLNLFTHIGCMSSKNQAYLNEHYRIKKNINTFVLPIWSKVRRQPVVDRESVRRANNLPVDITIAVFGGQIAPGRGIEDIVAMARMAQENSSKIFFLVIGTGPRVAWLKEQALDLESTLKVLPPCGREHYLDLIAACDIGLVITVPNVDVPSFPSKTLDYCCVGLPVAAAVEHSTDFGEFIETAGFGRYCEAGNPQALLRIIDKMTSDPTGYERQRVIAREYYENYFDVDRVAETISEMVEK